MYTLEIYTQQCQTNILTQPVCCCVSLRRQQRLCQTVLLVLRAAPALLLLLMLGTLRIPCIIPHMPCLLRCPCCSTTRLWLLRKNLRWLLHRLQSLQVWLLVREVPTDVQRNCSRRRLQQPSLRSHLSSRCCCCRNSCITTPAPASCTCTP
jgi:hypothetical protein